MKEQESAVEYKGLTIYEKDGLFTIGGPHNAGFDDCTLENLEHGPEEVDLVAYCRENDIPLQFDDLRSHVYDVSYEKYLEHLDKYKADPDGGFCDNEFVVPVVRCVSVEQAKGLIDWIEYAGLFVFNEELCVQDEKHECVDGYLWATVGLVSRLHAALSPSVDKEILASLENINFYPIYNLRDGTVELISTYYYYEEINGTIEEKHGNVQIPLSKGDTEALLSAMEQYCQKTYNMSCHGFLNEARQEIGLPALASCSPAAGPTKPSLEDRIEAAQAQVSVGALKKERPLDVPWR